MLKKVTQKEISVICGGAGIPKPPVGCVCGCDSPGCVDWIGQAIAITGGSASSLFM